MEQIYLLDACALIAYLTGEPGSEIVAQCFKKNVHVAMHKLNLFEVYYGFYFEQGEKCANEILADVKKMKIEIISDFSDDMLQLAGRLKASYRISSADSILVAQAMQLNATILSYDLQELYKLEELEQVKFFWIH